MNLINKNQQTPPIFPISFLERNNELFKPEQSVLETQYFTLNTYNISIFENVKPRITLDKFYNILKQLIIDIDNENFINYSQQEYINIVSIIINSRNSNIQNKTVDNLIKILYKNIHDKIKNIDIEVTKLSNEIIEKIDPKRLYILNGKKTLLYIPQLERHCNWYYNVLNNELIKSLGIYRDQLRSKYYMICQYIEDLLIKKLKIQAETIKLELTIKGYNHLILSIYIQYNLAKINEIKMEIERLIKLIDSNILIDKKKNFKILEDWFTENHEGKICPIYTKFVDKENYFCQSYLIKKKSLEQFYSNIIKA